MGMITTKEAADRLGVGARRVVALIKSGDLVADRFGRSWMVDESSVEARLKEPRLKGRPKLGQKRLLHLKSYVLMNRNHPVVAFTYDDERKRARIDSVLDDADWAPLGIGEAGKPNGVDLADWIARRYMPALRPEARGLLRAAGVSSVDELMFFSLGLNLSDQYWFVPAGASIDWHDANFFENGYEQDDAAPFRTPDSSTPGALEKRWERIDGVDTLVKGASTSERREPFNEALATRLAQRLLQPGEYVPYRVVMRDGVAYSACPTFVTPGTEFVPAADVATFGGISRGRDFYREYVRVCESLGVSNIRTALSKMIVFDHVMANFDRHLGNFGLVRTVETLDGWAPAPLFDNGAGFFSRATLAELERPRFTWRANPFEEYPSQQLARVEDLSWYDPSMLEDFADEVRDALSKNPSAPAGIADRAAYHVQRNIDAVNDIAAERAVAWTGLH